MIYFLAFLVTVVWLSPEGVQYIAEQCILYYAFADKNGDEKKDPSEVRFFFLVSILLLNAFKSFLSVPVCLMTFGDSNDVSKP